MISSFLNSALNDGKGDPFVPFVSNPAANWVFECRSSNASKKRGILGGNQFQGWQLFSLRKLHLCSFTKEV